MDVAVQQSMLQEEPGFLEYQNLLVQEEEREEENQERILGKRKRRD